MIDCTYIELNGLILYPSVDYVARLDGIMDFQKDVSESELFYDGAFYKKTKITSRDLTLSVIIKHKFNVNENKAEKQLNFILKEENIKLRFKLENEDNFYECIVNCTSKATNIDEITCTLHLSNPNIYKNGPINDIQRKKIKQDKIKYRVYTELGYKIIYIWEQDINNDFNKCTKQILVAVYGQNSQESIDD